MKSWKENASAGPHLKRLGHIDVKKAKDFALHDGHVFMCAKHDAEVLDILDVRDPGNVKRVATVPFKASLHGAMIHGNVLTVGEWGRALHFFDISSPTKPALIDVGVALGSSIYTLARLGPYAVAALNWDGVGLMDVENPRKARWVTRMKLAEGFVEDLVVANDHIFAAGASGGLVVFKMAGDKLEEVAKPCGEGYNASSVFAVGDTVWVCGSNDDDKNEIVVIDPKQPSKALHRMVTKVSMPNELVALGNGQAAGFFTHYSCAQYDPANNEAGMIFRQFAVRETGRYVEQPAEQVRGRLPDGEDDLVDQRLECMENIEHAVVSDGRIYASQGDQFSIYQPTEASVFRGAVGL